MATKKKLLQAAAGSAGGAALGVEDVFSTFLYIGNDNDSGADETNNIVNGLDLSNEKGLVWTKQRESGGNDQNFWYDTERGTNKYLISSNTNAQATVTNGLSSFNDDGFSFTGARNNYTGKKYCSWSFRAAPKFFDIITWSGDGTNAREISHNLDAVPHVMITRPYDVSAGGWSFAHYDGTTWRHGELNTQDAMSSPPSAYIWGDRSSFIAPTSSVITVAGPQTGVSDGMNKSGQSYITYLFASNSSDGTFGDDGDQDIIKCGSYTTDGSGLATVNLGWQPQWLLRKRISGGNTFNRNWEIFDKFRGWSFNNEYVLKANLNDAETGIGNQYNLTPTGFTVHEHSVNSPYVYIAIRGGDMKTPEDAANVFGVETWTGDGTYNRKITGVGFFPDFILAKKTSNTGGWGAANIQSNVDTSKNLSRLNTNESSAEVDTHGMNLPDYMDGFQITNSGVNYFNTSSDDYVGYAWKRAKGYFDVVRYFGTGSTTSQNVSHNLGVVPEMIWVKDRDGNTDWFVYHKDVGKDKYLIVNGTDAEESSTTHWHNTLPTDARFTVGRTNDTNSTSGDYIAYLFATVSGVSKVGSFSHTTGSDTNVNCGFTSGARFVLWKQTDSANGWGVVDTERGLVAGNDPLIQLQTNGAEQTQYDLIDPLSSGFVFTGTFGTGTYIFYAIA